MARASMATTMNQILVDSIISQPLITESIDAQGNSIYHGELLISVADHINRNNRVYPALLWRREAANANARAQQGLLTGQAEHPEGAPELLDTIIKFTGTRYEETSKATYATFDVIPTSKGKDFAIIAKAGVAIGCSTRGSGSAKKGTFNGKETSIIQDDYTLDGIDIMLMGQQSEVAAKLMQFETIQLTTEQPMYETVNALREAQPNLVTELETAARAPLEAQLTDSQTQRDATQTALATLQATYNALVETVRQNEAALSAQSEAAQIATKRVEALTYLYEKAQDTKQNALLVMRLLKDAPDKATIDAQFEAVCGTATKLIEHALLGAGQLIAAPQDDPASPDTKTPAPEAVKFIGNPAVISRASGLRIPS